MNQILNISVFLLLCSLIVVFDVTSGLRAPNGPIRSEVNTPRSIHRRRLMTTTTRRPRALEANATEPTETAPEEEPEEEPEEPGAAPPTNETQPIEPTETTAALEQPMITTSSAPTATPAAETEPPEEETTPSEAETTAEPSEETTTPAAEETTTAKYARRTTRGRGHGGYQPGY